MAAVAMAGTADWSLMMVLAATSTSSPLSRMLTVSGPVRLHGGLALKGQRPELLYGRGQGDHGVSGRRPTINDEAYSRRKSL